MDKDKRVAVQAEPEVIKAVHYRKLGWPILHVGQQVEVEGFPFTIARQNTGSVVLRPAVGGISARAAIRRLFSEARRAQLQEPNDER